jgi:hypothetical protein
MANDNSAPMDYVCDSDYQQNAITSSVIPRNNTQRQSVHAETRLSQATSLASTGSSSSIGSTSSDVRIEDKLFDTIEDMIRDYMRDSDRHYLQCRVLRWHLDDDQSPLFSAVVVINPPIFQA